MSITEQIKTELGVTTNEELKNLALKSFTGVGDNVFLKALSNVIGQYEISDLIEFSNQYNGVGVTTQKLLAFGEAILTRHVSDQFEIEVDPYNRTQGMYPRYVDNVQVSEEFVTNPYKARIVVSITQKGLITAFTSANPIATIVGQMLKSMTSGLEMHLQTLTTKILKATTPLSNEADGFNVPVVIKNRFSLSELTGDDKPTSKIDGFRQLDSLIAAMTNKRTDIFYTQNVVADKTKLIGDDNITLASEYKWTSTTGGAGAPDGKYTRQISPSDLVIVSGNLIKMDYEHTMGLVYRNGELLSNINKVTWVVVQGLDPYDLFILEKGAIDTYTQLDIMNTDISNGLLTANYYKHLWLTIQARKYKFGVFVDTTLISTLPTGIGSALIDAGITFKSKLVKQPILKSPRVKKGTNT